MGGGRTDGQPEKAHEDGKTVADARSWHRASAKNAFAARETAPETGFTKMAGATEQDSRQAIPIAGGSRARKK